MIHVAGLLVERRRRACQPTSRRRNSMTIAHSETRLEYDTWNPGLRFVRRITPKLPSIGAGLWFDMDEAGLMRF